MTEQEFKQLQDETLSTIPVRFHPDLKKLAWDRGHGGGHGDVLCELRELVQALDGLIQKYYAVAEQSNFNQLT